MASKTMTKEGLRRRLHGSPKPKRTTHYHRYHRFAQKHTWTIPLALIIAILALYAQNPTETNILHPFLFLSYKQHDGKYGKGLWDLAFVSFYVISRSKQARFMEQAYTAIYFAILGPVGLYVMRQTPVWYFDTKAMYEGFPHRVHGAEFKAYYLFEAAYWAQQALVMVLGMEKPRKDFRELVMHHVVTLVLIGLSYRFHFAYMGIAIYITHDISDFFLALSKSLHYYAPDVMIPFYAASVVSWVYLRHVLNLRVLYSILTEFHTVGPYELNWETQQYKCWISKVITFSLLASLQALNLFWLYYLLRSAVKFLITGEKKDDRSEDESEVELEQSHLKANGLNCHANGNGVLNGRGPRASVKMNGSR
ncbi:unnamed protein product [Penicillium salamii]|nr:unnamed protein product [Penicillium salamii]